MSPFSPARTAGVAIGAVVSAAALVGALALVSFDLPRVAPDRGTISVSAVPPASPSVATCAGPVLASGRDSTQAALLTDAAPAAVTTAAADGVEPDESSLSAVDVSDGAGPAVRTAAPSRAGDRVDVAAAASAQLAAPDLSGLAASACTRAQMESWLVGGSAATGAADLVLLGNPGDVPALVTLGVYGAAGLTMPATGKDIIVPAGAQRVIPLAALALGEENPIVHVTSAQAPVQASLQTSLTRGLVPIGVDQVDAAPAPGLTLVVPAVPVTLGPADPGASDVPLRVRLLSPAAGSATVTVRPVAVLPVTSGGGATAPSAAPQTQTVPLGAGVPLQLELSGLAAGAYTVTVDATTPVTGAVWAATGFGAGSDFAWYTPAQPLVGPTLAAVAVGLAPMLTLAADAERAVTVTIAPVGGAAGGQQVTVPAGGAVAVPVTAGEGYLLTPEGGGDVGGIRASVTFTAPGAVAGYPVQPSDAAAAAIAVFPR